MQRATLKRSTSSAAPSSRELADGGAPAAVGFLLLDESLQVVYANSEAVRILTYPAVPGRKPSLGSDVAKRIRAQLETWPPLPGQPVVTELASGRRRYVCRAFALEPESGSLFATTSFQRCVAVLLERGHRAFGLARVGDQYHLSPREREAMGLLLHGLTSRQIAERMRVSPNTVKTFLRLIMLRMSVSTRSGIVGKILANGV